MADVDRNNLPDGAPDNEPSFSELVPFQDNELKKLEKLEQPEDRYVPAIPEKKSDGSMGLYDWMQCIVSALIFGIMLFLFVGRVVGVDGWSMLPTLENRDRVLISNFFYTPKQGDIVILQAEAYDDEPLVKRVIATAGQTVDIDFQAGIVSVDGVALQEDYTAELTYTQLDFHGPVTVPDGCVFVMGDNRNESTDSRDSRIGMVDTRCIMGKVYLILIPGEDRTGAREWSRVGSVYG